MQKYVELIIRCPGLFHAINDDSALRGGRPARATPFPCWGEGTARGQRLLLGEQLALRLPLVFCTLVVGLLFAATFAILSPGYQTNDDPQLAMIVAGKGISLAPDEHLIFSNVVVGQALAWLYQTFPSMPWYGVYLYGIQYAAFVAIMYGVVGRQFNRWRLALFLCYFASVGVVYVNHLQYTTTAALAGQAGVLLCLLALGDRFQGSCRYCVLAGGLPLLLIASLVRLECFYLTALIGGPAAVWVLGFPPRRAVLVRGAVCASICLSAVFGLSLYNDAYYRQDPQWRQFLDYNNLRIKFNDYGWTRYTPETAAVFAAAAWSENDHALIEHWFYDAPPYSSENLQQILAGYPWRETRLTAAYVCDSVVEILRDKSLWPMLLVFPLALWGMDRSRRNLLTVGSSIVAGLGLLALLAVLTKAPPARVYFPVLTFPLALALCMTRDRIAIPLRRWPRLAIHCFVRPATWRRPGAQMLLRPTMVHALLLLALIGLGMAGNRQYRASYRTQVLRQELRACLARLENDQARLYVSWPTDFPWVALSPFDNLDSLSERNLLMLSWTQRTPIARTMKARHSIDDTMRALCLRPDVVLLGDATARPLVERYIRQHHGLDVHFAVLFSGGHAFDEAGRFEPVAEREIATVPESPARARRQ